MHSFPSVHVDSRKPCSRLSNDLTRRCPICGGARLAEQPPPPSREMSGTGPKFNGAHSKVPVGNASFAPCQEPALPRQDCLTRSYAAGIAITGQGACRITRSVVLPRNISRMLRWPAVGIPMKPTSNSMATSMIVLTTLPDRSITCMARVKLAGDADIDGAVCPT